VKIFDSDESANVAALYAEGVDAGLISRSHILTGGSMGFSGLKSGGAL
jgi:hypothetical protein